MKRMALALSLSFILILLSGCVSAANMRKTQVIQEKCTVEQFIALYGKPIKAENNGMTQEEYEKYYRVLDITPINVYEEIGCKIFKINSTCETYIVYKGKIYPIGSGFGGWGVVDINTCDFDNDKQKDIIYTYSWGSGLHRSHISIFNFTKMKETAVEYVHLNKDMMLEKTSDNEYKVFDAGIKPLETMDYTKFALEKRELLLTIKSVDNQPKIKIINQPGTTQPAPSIGIYSDQPPEIEITVGDMSINCIVSSTRWNGVEHDRGDVFQTIVYGNDIPYFRRDTVFQIELNGAEPDSVELRDDVLNEDGSRKYTQRETQTTTIDLKQNNGSFTLTTNPAAYLSSNSADYEPGAVIRGFRFVCTWGDNSCEYAFVIRSDP